MGCDIHSRAEVFNGTLWEPVGAVFPLTKWERECHKASYSEQPFRSRNYALFGWLAGVRNYSAVTPIAAPRGIPKDSDFAEIFGGDYYLGDHSFSWVSLAELNAVDYDASVEDRRVGRQISERLYDGACTAEKGGGRLMPLREFLGTDYFDVLGVLNTLGEPDKVRVVFGFDN